ncbi:hypothetical protein Tco_0269200 [Tanacetum coccineum]
MTGGTIFSDTVFVAHTRKCLLHVMLDECLLQSHVRFYILAVSGNWRDNCPMHMYYAAWEMLYRAKCNMGIYGSCHVLTCKYLDDVLDLSMSYRTRDTSSWCRRRHRSSIDATRRVIFRSEGMNSVKGNVVKATINKGIILDVETEQRKDDHDYQAKTCINCTSSPHFESISSCLGITLREPDNMFPVDLRSFIPQYIIVLSSESEDINEGSSKGNVPKEDINGGPSKGKLPPLGSSARPRPEVGPKLAKLFNPEKKPKTRVAWIHSQYVHVVKSASKKAIFKSPQTIIGVVLGLANLKTWDDIVQKMGKRPLGSYANKGKGKAKV